MKKTPVPEGYQQVMPYLIVEDAASFSRFLATVFSAEEVVRHQDDENRIVHAEARIGDSTVMFADSTDNWKPMTGSMFIYVPDADEAYKIALGEGATTIMEPADQPYGRSCGITDPSGNVWWITSVQ